MKQVISNKYIKLSSVGCYYHSEEQFIYPMLQNGNITLSNNTKVHLNDCSCEWWENLSRKDEDLIFKAQREVTK
tara:strand:- start:583 stop:804 length:222 start_codon:yes stop_codon:yes gene_type:complete